MDEMQDELMEQAMRLLEQAPTWHELRRALDAEGLTDRLGPAGMDRVLAAWQRRAAESLSDRDLAAELAFWAEGGTFTAHLKGFQATPPDLLVEAAQRRGWFVRIGSAGTALVNPPDGRPLALRIGLGGKGGRGF